jgi:putative transcriptional regulator
VYKEDLIENVRDILAKAGFYVSRTLVMRRISFDVVARRDKILLIIKVLGNIDSFSKENAEELKVLAEALEASPLVIGERSGSGDMEEGIVYSRFGIPIVSIDTLSDFVLEGIPPFIFAAPGGLYVKLDSELLRKLREEKNISLGTLAEVAGVSRRTIQMYESGMGATIDVATRIEDYLNELLVVPLDPFIYNSRTGQHLVDLNKLDVFGQEVFGILDRLGYSIVPTVKCPFEALTSHDRTLILTGLGKDESRLVEKAHTVADISKITERKSMIFIERFRNRCSIGGTPLIGRDELKKMDESDKLFDLVISRSGSNEKR